MGAWEGGSNGGWEHEGGARVGGCMRVGLLCGVCCYDYSNCFRYCFSNNNIIVSAELLLQIVYLPEHCQIYPLNVISGAIINGEDFYSISVAVLCPWTQSVVQ